MIDLLVIGAGPAGSVAAIHAARDGMRVTLVERFHHPRPKACAEYASPRIAEELARAGLPLAAWRETAVPLDGMRIVVDEAGFDVRYADRRGARTAWGLDRRAFDALLAAEAQRAGATLLEGTSLVELTRDEDGRVRGAVLAGADGRRRTISADHLIGADGARSRVARLLGVERPVRAPRRLGLVAHYTGLPELQRSGEMHVGRGWYVGLAPTPGGELNVGMALPFGAPGGTKARFEAAIAGLPAVAQRLDGARRCSPIRGAAPIGHRVAEVAGEGWMLIGDAAGFIDPFTGEGIYRALRSARAATRALHSADPTASYRAERRAAFGSKDALTWLVQGMLAARPLLGYVARRLNERPAMALRLGSALGDCRPASDAFSPRLLASVLRP
ncbi:MAG: NAD(P)/FAD-dependent oxidoreductase [Chloroflexota bacterium]